MATIVQILNDVPVNIVSSKSLVEGTKYSCQYIGPNNILMKFIESVDVPEVGDDSGLIEPLKSITAIPKSGEGIYVWLRSSDNGVLIINEVL